MAALKLVGRMAVSVLALASSAPAPAETVGRWAAPIREAALRFALPEDWIRRVMRAESGGALLWQGRPVQSSAGAMGLMQLMPATWRELRAAHGLGWDPYDPHDNIVAGAAYLRAMYDRFGYPGMFAAYNAGPARYAGHLANGRPLPRETVAYVAKVVSAGRGAVATASRTVPAHSALFAVRVGFGRAVGTGGGEPSDGSIFVALAR